MWFFLTVRCGAVLPNRTPRYDFSFITTPHGTAPYDFNKEKNQHRTAPFEFHKKHTHGQALGSLKSSTF